MKINTGYSYNIPTFGQLYQPSHGSIDQARGNPDLDKEGVWSNDLAVEYRMSKRHLFQLALFRTDTDDTILYQRGSDRVFSPVNGGHSWRQGIEATWKYTFGFGLAVDTDVIVQDSRIEETDNELMYTPHLKVKLALMYTVPNPGTRLEAVLRYNREQFSEMENRSAERIDDYYTVDVKMIQPFKLDTVSVELFFNIINLFDVDYDVHFGYPDDGFRVVMGVNMMF